MNCTKEIINNFNEINENYLDYPLTFIHMNIRSLRKNFLTFLVQIKKIINKIHLLILTETNITNNENQYYHIDGFNAIFLNR